VIRSIEGLRGVAALMVVFFHAFVLARWGGVPAQWGLVQNAWLFVDLFFVISGAIMAMVYGQRLQDGRQVRAFFIKRFFRLYPLHLVTTLTAIGAVIVVQGAKWAAAQAGVQLGGEQPFAVEFFKLSYFLLELVMLQGVGIMTEALHNYPSWSLSVEFWLYLAFAVLFFFVRSTRARVWASVAIVVLCLDHFLRVFSGLGPQVLAPDVHGMPRGLLSFFIGVLVWYGWQAVQPRLRNLSSPVLGACQLVLAVLSLALIDMRADLGAWVYAIPFVFGLWVWSLLPDRGVVAAFLQEEGFHARAYHAGLEAAERSDVQAAFQREDGMIVVATIAFGMGIDKPDVRLVVHLDPPDSIEAYFQEAGRAGRDGAPARSILLFNARDTRSLSQRIGQTFPAKDKVREIYDDVAYFLQVGEGEAEGKVREFDLEKFCAKFKHFPLTVVNAFTILERAGYLSYTDKHDTKSRIMMIVQRDELYRIHLRARRGDKVLTTLLRQYTGIFSDYIFIEEATLAEKCDLTEHQVYHALKALNAERIIHYIPRKNVATVTYLTPRVDGQKLALTPEVYEKRLEQYEHRINSMLTYCTDPTTCRSQLLLSYFDETDSTPCGLCDVCQDHPLSTTSNEELCAQLLQVLADGQGHAASEFQFAHLDEHRVQQAIAQLLNDEAITFDGALFYKV